MHGDGERRRVRSLSGCLPSSFKMFLVMFCPACGWQMKQSEESTTRYCDNAVCKERGTAYEVITRVLKITPAIL